MFGGILIWFSATKIIGSLTFKPDSIYQIINIEVNICYPLLDMYTYVRSKIDEFDKEEQKEYKYDFYNYD